MVVPIPSAEYRPESWLNRLPLASEPLPLEVREYRQQAKRQKVLARLPALSLRPVNPHLHADLIQMSEEVADALGAAPPFLYEMTGNCSNVLLALLFCSPDMILINFDFFKRLTANEQKAMMAHELQHSRQPMHRVGLARQIASYIETLAGLSASPARHVGQVLLPVYRKCVSYIDQAEEEADDAAVACTDPHALSSAVGKYCAYVLENYYGEAVEEGQSAIDMAMQVDEAINRQHHSMAHLTGQSLTERIHRLDAIAREQSTMRAV